jgi:NADH-quinone oxidoreductase subunit M
MYKRIFFGKIPEELAHVKDSNRYITVTMAAFAALTLIIGILPDIFLNPITDYIGGMFEGQEGVLPVPVHAEVAQGGMLENIPAQGEGE